MKENSKVMHGEKYFEAEQTAVWTHEPKEYTYLRHVDHCINKAQNMISKLPDRLTIQSLLGGASLFVDGKSVEIPDIPFGERLIGMSGVCFRHFLNNICEIPKANYLEVGTYGGSSLVSAAYGNGTILNEVHAIDNFSEFIREDSGYHPRDDLQRNMNLHLGDMKDKIKFHEEDCFEFDLKKLPKIQVYFYDGEHSMESQRKAFTYFEPVFDDVFIAIVDDWEQRQARLGTIQGLEEIGYDIVGSRAIIPGKRVNNVNRVNNPDPLWWSGTYIAVLKKRAVNV